MPTRRDVIAALLSTAALPLLSACSRDGDPAEASDEDLDRAIDEALRTHTPSRAAAEVAAALNIPKKRAYARALERSK